MTIKNYMVDVAFTVEGPYENWEDIPKEVMLEALGKRIEDIRQDEYGMEAFGCCDVYNVEDYQ